MTESSNTIALMFPGQGSQFVGMGKDLYEKYPAARETFEEADATLGYKLSQLCFEGPEDQLRLTEITQPAILTVSVAALRVLEMRIPRPAYVAGHSLGEYSAHVASGTMTFAEAVSTVRNRGKYMQEAVPVGVGTMGVILGLELADVTAICREAAQSGGQNEVCEPANINYAEQIVISGHTAAVERALRLADEGGAKRAKLLPVSAPFHCSLMKPAQDRLKCDLNELKLRPPVYPIACNVDADLVTDDLRALDTLLRQVTGSVRWDECMKLLIALGVQTFIEVGPGKVLAGLLRQIDRSKNCMSVGDEASLEKATETLKAAA